jgi:hypothetical protein
MDLEARSQPAFFSALDGVFRGVHFSDADGLVIVSDCDDSELHDPAHDRLESRSPRCRLCKARAIIERARSQLRPRQRRAALRVAIGLAVPAIEAWYLVGNNHQIGEAAWKAGLAANQPPFTRANLKRLVYGTDRPSLELETERAVAEARRIIANMKAIEDAFPAGFGLMSQEIKSWKAS